MSEIDENKELQMYLKSAFKKEIDAEEDDSEDLDAVDSVTDPDEHNQDTNETDGILLYADGMQQYSSNEREANKAIKMDHDSTDALDFHEELTNKNQDVGVYDYNESTVIENDGDSSLIKPKGTVHILSDERVEVTLCCPKCVYTTNKRFLLTRHIKTHSDERPFKCNVCDRGFKSNTALSNHVNMHLGKKPHHCKSCEMRFNTAGELARHVRYKHTHEKPHKCGECDYSSVELSKMRRHMRMHTGERPYQCPHCTYASPDTFKLKRHLRTHTGEKPYECDICMARFTQSNSLKSHKLIHSVGERPVFQCTLCPTTCGRKTDLQLHILKLHTSDRPIRCKRCGKELPDRYTYKVHVKTHDGEKCYRCRLCPYASISQRHLDMHMLIHTDEKPFRCEQCDMAFRHIQLLKRHTNIYHTENYVPPTPQPKNHICPHCGRAFLRKGNLMHHMEIHDGKLSNDLKKAKLKLGRQIRTTDVNGKMTMQIETIDDRIIYESDEDDTKNIEYIEEDEEEDCKYVETFELVDMFDENVEAKDETVECNFIYESSKSQINDDEIATTSRAALLTNSKRKMIKTETMTRPSNIVIVPSRSAAGAVEAAKKEQNLPIEIDLGLKDAASEQDHENVVVIEVIEDDDMIDDSVDSDEPNSYSANNVLEIPYQAINKQEHINEFDYVDNTEYVEPFEVPEED